MVQIQILPLVATQIQPCVLRIRRDDEEVTQLMIKMIQYNAGDVY